MVWVTRPLCSPPCWHVRRLQRWAWERVGRGKLLLRCRRRRKALRRPRGEERGGAYHGGHPPTACLEKLCLPRRHKLTSLAKATPLCCPKSCRNGIEVEWQSRRRCNRRVEVEQSCSQSRLSDLSVSLLVTYSATRLCDDYNYDSIIVRLAFHCSSTALRPFDDLHCDRRSTCCCVEA